MKKEFNEEDALKVIRQSIEQTRESFKEKGLIYLLAGWLGFVAIIANFLMIRFTSNKNTDITQTALMAICGIASVIALAKNDKKPGEWFTGVLNKNPIANIWWGFGATMFISLLRMNDLGPGVYPIMIMLFGFAATATGSVLSAAPLIKGGNFCYFLALASFFFKGEYADYRMLFLAAALLSAFIIPGHLLRASK